MSNLTVSPAILQQIGRIAVLQSHIEGGLALVVMNLADVPTARRSIDSGRSGLVALAPARRARPNGQHFDRRSEFVRSCSVSLWHLTIASCGRSRVRASSPPATGGARP